MVNTVVHEEKEYIYTSWDLPLLKESKWKPQKSLIILQDNGNGIVTVSRKDGRGCNSQGQTQIEVLYKHLKPVPKNPLEPFSTEKSDNKLGVKYDAGKLEHSLMPTGVVTNILRVLGFGKKKYAANNWQNVDNAKERYYIATMRHITSWWEGEKTDPETGENHLAHAACCILFLLWFDNKETGKD
jgi:hypothetical protein